MQTETIFVGQKVRFSLDCGKTWRIGVLNGFTEKNVTIATRKYETVAVAHKFLGVTYKKTSKRVSNVVCERIAIPQACTMVLSIGQYNEMKELERLEKKMYELALKYAVPNKGFYLTRFFFGQV